MNRFFHFLFIFSCSTGLVFSQDIRPSIGMQLEEEMTLQSGMNALDIQIYNNSDAAFVGYLQLVLPEGLGSLAESEIPVRIKAGRKRYLSIKLLPQQLARLDGKEIAALLKTDAGELVQQRVVRLQVEAKRSFQLMDNTALQHLRELGDSVYVKLRVFNNGTTAETIRLILSSPDRMGDREFQETALYMPAGQDTLLSYSIAVEKYMIQLPQYTVRVSGVYGNNDVFGNMSISFPNISSSRNYQQMYRTDSRAYNYTRNYIDMQVDQGSSGLPVYMLRSTGTYAAMDGKLKYNFYLNQWGDILSRPNISNTFLEYEHKNKTFAVGNLQESLEASFYGRGATFTVRDSAKDNIFSTGVAERSSDLLGYYSAIDHPGINAFARLVLADQDPDRKRYEGQLYYEDDRTDSTRSVLWANSFELLKKEKAERIQMNGFIAAGAESFDVGSSADIVSQPSVALGLKLVGRTLGNLAYSSDNFYSTPYYTGNRRGVIQLSQRVNKSSGKTSYGAGVNYSRYNPSYMDSRLTSQGSDMLRMDLTLYRSLSPFVSLNLQSSFNTEHLDYYSVGQQETALSAQSWQAMGSANVRSKNYKHSFYLAMETGMMSVRDHNRSDLILRSNLNYNFGKLGLSASYQKGAFRIYELLNYNDTEGLTAESRFVFGASYGGTLLNGKLTWNTHFSNYSSSSYGNSYTANISGNYRVLKNTLLTSLVRYSHTEGANNYRYDYSNFRIGIRQNLKSRNLDRPAVRTGTLNVFCYYDNNHNNIFDAGDEIASGYNFLVGGVNFVTDRKGRAEYKKLPYGERVLFFPASNGYQGLSRVIDLQSRSVSVAIPLQKVSQVRGSLIIRYDAKLSLEANLDLDLYTIVARDQDNHTYEVRTNAQGRFLFSLPQGEYSIYIKSDTFPENIFSEDNVRTVTVEVGKNQELEPFVLQVRNKTIEVKRFGK